MRILSMAVGMIGTNCYILVSDKENCFIIDPGAEADRITAKLEEEKIMPKAILLTHGHFDHIGGAEQLVNTYHIPVYLNRADHAMAEDPELNASRSFGLPDAGIKADFPLENGDTVSLDELTLRIIETPGHTMGSVSLYLPEKKVLFSGDTLFRGGYGRTDLYGGSYESLQRSLQKLMTLPEETRVLPGHGAETTILKEKW